MRKRKLKLVMPGLHINVLSMEHLGKKRVNIGVLSFIESNEAAERVLSRFGNQATPIILPIQHKAIDFLEKRSTQKLFKFENTLTKNKKPLIKYNYIISMQPAIEKPPIENLPAKLRIDIHNFFSFPRIKK